MDDGIRRRVNPDWVTNDIPKTFRHWQRTDDDYSPDAVKRMQQAGWDPIPGVAWGCGTSAVWCAWDNDGIIAWKNYNTDVHWIRHPNTKFQYAFEITPLF